MGNEPFWHLAPLPDKTVTKELIEKMSTVSQLRQHEMMIQETLHSNPSQRSQEVQIKMLGCKINDIQHGLVMEWHLPRTLLHLIDDHFTDEPRVRIVNLAVAMARHLEKGWDSPYFLDDLQQCALLIKLEPYLLYEQIRDVALKAARHWAWYEEQPAAAMLIR
jgi:hypothetical protein